MMTRIFWDAVFLISGSLFTFGAGQSSSAIIEANISIDTNSTAAPNTSSSSSVPPGSSDPTATVITTTETRIDTVKSSFFTFEEQQTNTTIDATISINTTSAAAPNISASSSPATSSRDSTTKSLIPAAHATTIRPLKKFVAAAVRSHFDDCPDSQQHFCFHGTCRFLIQEEAPACVCHPGFVGMRCEHADLLAVVATNHRQQTVATVLVLCVIGCVLIMVLCTLLHCWWRQDCRRRSYAHHYVAEKHGVSCYPSESVV
ncbi:protransforming growth factor alpha isoform X2 [Amphiprion ocellaris]|uniref:EGF-like domain-containing protein n=1 Tax=Amphiprion ocellaris TaxID=80972 RepID=A0AAQ5WXB3_AMPOC|nr:protransforming growth factor alpha isoform X2 [Amphiprion ocellaris]